MDDLAQASSGRTIGAIADDKVLTEGLTLIGKFPGPNVTYHICDDSEN